MSHRLDAETAESLAQLAAARPAVTAQRGDWRTLRAEGDAGQAHLSRLAPPSHGVTRRTFWTDTADGARLELRWYQRGSELPGPAIVYAHGGGMILGTLDNYDTLLDAYVSATGVPFLSVGYRLAPEVRGEALAEDVYAALAWLLDHAGEPGIDLNRVAVMGDSGGGAPAAGCAILARDRGVRLAHQILVYPMLDDRNTDPDPRLAAFATWTYDNNWTAWTAVLGQERGSGRVSPVTAPSRLTDATGLAPAYIEVGDLDIFRDEDIAYAATLAGSGVPVELHVHPGVPHGFDRFAPECAVSRRAFSDRMRVISAI